MSSRISGGISARNPFGPSWGTKGAKESGQAQSVGEQVQENLFGKKKPPILDVDDAHIAAQMARLHAWRRRLAALAGDQEDDYDLVLSSGTIAMIDEKGLIYVGKEWLLGWADEPGVLAGVLAHEIGHRPKRWAEYRSEQPTTKDEAEKLCRLEETRADFFAGKALAEMGLACEPLIGFLRGIQVHPHPEYFSAELRAEVIREGWDDGKRRSTDRAKFFPEFARLHGARGDLGSG